MKQKIVLALFAVILVVTLCSNSGGYGANVTGSAGASSGCASCHNSTTSIATTLELDSAGVPVTSYYAGLSYTVKIRAVNSTALTLPRFGCQVSLVKLATAGTGSAVIAGTWGTMPTGLTNHGIYVGHNTPLTPSSGTGASGTTYTEIIPWTAPVAGTGSVKIYGTINAVNNNGSSSGDATQAATAVTITEAAAATITASVSIAVTSGSNTTCSGVPVTFTASPTNGGTAPTYQWKVGTTVVGTGATFTSSTLANGNVVTCVMTSNLAGVSGSPATSNAITMNVTTSVTDSVNITASATTICFGTSVTFTAHPFNGGTPAYQWKVGATVVGTGATYTSTTLANGNVVTCVMTPTGTCVSPATSTSNAITMVVNSNVVDSVNITASTTTVCAGTSVTFTAHPFNGGATPAYQWKVGATVVGTGVTYTSTTLANGNVVTCVMTPSGSCASPATATSNAITMTITPSVTDSVQITASATTICAGTSVTFTAHPFNGGTTPTYQWKVGATVVGTGVTYTSTTLANGNVVTCVMTPSGTCFTPATSTSRPITMVVNPTVTDSVNITASATTICAGTSVTFTAHPFNGGTPTYQWKVGATVVGTGTTYTSTTLANGNVVTCVMTPTGSCVSPATSTSNAITMIVNTSGTDSVQITATATTICAGTSVTFTAHPFNGGASPTYQWKVGATVVGTGVTYTSTTLANGNVVTCVMTPSGTCATPATSTSRPITMVVNPSVTDSVNITSTATTICSGASVTFTAHPFNGGTPTYQWKVGATVVGTGATYTSTTLANGNVVTCVMTPSGSCVSPATATSNAITMTVNATGTDSVQITATAATICAGGSVTFTAHPFNGGASPTYQWKVGATVVGTGVTYTSTTLANGNVVTCVMTPSGTCATPATSTSRPITMVVNPSVVDSVNITSTTATICSGASVTFTAHPFNGGTPTYQWKVGTTVVGAGVTYTSSTLANGNVVTCVMTPSGCATPATATSNAITMTVNPSGTDSVSITASATSICAGTSVTFTAHPTNGGASPTYQWKIGTTVVGTGVTYTSTTLANGNAVSCVMTPSGSCFTPATSTSNVITMAVNSTPSVDSVRITSTATTVCTGTSVTFTAQPFNGGASPTYQWKIGTTNVGAGSTYTSTTLANGNVVTCVMTPSGACVSPATSTSNAITMTVNSSVTPTINITGNTAPCSGSADTIIAQISGGGSSPSFAWQVNGSPAGTNSNILILPSVTAASAVTCTMTSSSSCASPTAVTSNILNLTATSSSSASINITTPQTSICDGASVLFTANSTGGGANPQYQWYINSNQSINNNTLLTSSLVNGDTVSCVLTSSSACVSQAQLTSNLLIMTVHSAPSATLVPSANVSVCTGDSVLLTAGGGTSYDWSNGHSGPTIWVSQPGNYDVTVTDVNGCTASPVSAATVALQSAITPTITQAGNVVTSSVAVAYQWLLNGTALAGDTNQSITITQSGSYIVSILDANGCHGASVPTILTYTPDTTHSHVGIQAVASDLGVRLYPVPNHGSFVVDMTEYADAQLVIYDVYGKALYHQAISAAHQEISDLQLSAALYFVQISSGSKVQVIKMQVVKE